MSLFPYYWRGIFIVVSLWVTCLNLSKVFNFFTCDFESTSSVCCFLFYTLKKLSSLNCAIMGFFVSEGFLQLIINDFQ